MASIDPVALAHAQQAAEDLASAPISDPGVSNAQLARAWTKPWVTDEEAERYARDPKKYLLKKCEPFVKGLTMATHHCLVATFFMPEFVNIKGAGGKVIPFYLSDKTHDEATWQGRVGLLIAKGPLCWVDTDRTRFGGTKFEIGDWVCFDRQDGRQTAFQGVHCRQLVDVDIWAKTALPASVY